MRYFGLTDDEKMLPLGDHDDWFGADIAAENMDHNFLWILSEINLRGLQESIERALDRKGVKERRILVATIQNRHGVEIYAAKDIKSLYEKIHEYVRDFWEAEFDLEESPPETDDMDTMTDQVEEYFNRLDSEILTIECVKLNGRDRDDETKK